jgi:hypothetical protein
MLAILPIPHEGPMNVSIVKTATNTILGDALISFDSYADEKLASLPPNNTDFSFTMPRNLAATDCVKPGECVLQWFWFGTEAKQTYESCVDFVMAPAGKNNTAGAPARGKASSVPVASAVPAASAVPKPFASAPAASAPAIASFAKASTIAAQATIAAAVPASQASTGVAAAAPAISPLVLATPLEVQPADVIGGVVGTIPLDKAGPGKKIRRAFAYWF